MPKAKKVSVLAVDENTGARERIILHKETRKKFAKVGSSKRSSAVTVEAPCVTPLTVEESKAASDYHREHRYDLKLLSELVIAKQKLDRMPIDSSPPILTFITNTSSSLGPSTAPHIPPPIPASLSFHKGKFELRVKEVYPMIHATFTRLRPIFNKLDIDKEFITCVQVPFHVRYDLWTWFSRLMELRENLENIGQKLGKDKWKQLTKAMRMIRKVNFQNLKGNFEKICRELYDLNITLP